MPTTQATLLRNPRTLALTNRMPLAQPMPSPGSPLLTLARPMPSLEPPLLTLAMASASAMEMIPAGPMRPTPLAQRA